MKAVTWHGKRDVRVDTVPDPKVEASTDAIIEVTSTNICGSDLHLYEVLGAFMTAGDILGHEPMGIVREVGPEITNLAVGDRVVIPFQISCGSCYMCDQELFTQCETTQVRDQGMGAALFGYSELYGAVPGGQAELLRVPQAQFTHIKVPEGPPDSRFVYLSDVLPDSMAGGGLCRHSRRRLGNSAGVGSDRRYGGPHRVPSGLRGNRRGPSARAARQG
jgi:threonine dehydrogenase-like Zn-dependent dehydrogenase